MSDQIKHECGITLIRLLQPLEYFEQKYGSPLYGLQKMQLILQKMRNRGQDGAGIVTIKLDPKPGTRYISRKRNNSSQSLRDLFNEVSQYFKDVSPEQLHDAEWMKDNKPFTGELLLGHLRYGTHGANSIETCHPFLRQNNWINRNLVLAGNFNLTNVDELFEELLDLGQYPKEVSDTVTVLEKIGHFLDDEVQRLFTWFKLDGYSNREINALIEEHLDIQRLLSRASKKFDGGYVMGGLIGHGDAFMLRDPNGIRPAFYYHDDEILVAASERPAIQTAFKVRLKYVKELQPGHALIIKKDGRVSEQSFTERQEYKACSFERIYFSRGTDKDIYLERKSLGEQLTDQVLKAIDYDFANTVFSYVPNTAETAFFGLMEGVEKRLNDIKKEKIIALGKDSNPQAIEDILSIKARFEKIVVKDAKMRTFIADTEERGEMVSHVYDVTYGIVRNNIDTLVLVDDSIVRGTTLRDSIITMVDRLHPRRIVFVSSAPQIRYPDCYGIDMSVMGNFIAFEAMVALIKQHGKQHMLDEVYELCKRELQKEGDKFDNKVKALYDQFSYEEVSQKISEILTPASIDAEVKIIFQTLDGLRVAVPNHRGDWYFSGDYPTPGGQKVVNKAFINFMEKKLVRAYS
ncbi:MAG: class II glutamine amidotransferase [Saprospiraceae bacterium]|nr:class II glutamine amidotransferase [Saprospiraceae bacterium]